MKTIPLTQGQVAIVDDEDYDFLSQWKWHATYSEKTRSFYAKRGVYINKVVRIISMHRDVMKPLKDEIVDHINHDTLDNRRENLRVVTSSQNCMNRRNWRLQYKGVYWHKERRRYRAIITAGKMRKHLGYFKRKKDAAKAYNLAAQLIHKEYALLNKI